MGFDGMFSGCKKIFTLAAMCVILAGFIGCFITTITWWNRIQPYFAHGYDEGKTVYQCILACWVLSMIGMVILAILVIFTLCIHSMCEKITGNTIILIVCFILVGGISVGSIISGGYGASFALKNPTDKDNEDQKCSKYLSTGSAGILNYAKEHPDKYKDILDWLLDLKDHKEGYLCRDVGAPTMTFVLVQCVGLILFIVIIIMALIC